MIGCFGEALTTELSPDFAELEDCRWFSREELALILRREHPDGITTRPAGRSPTTSSAPGPRPDGSSESFHSAREGLAG